MQESSARRAEGPKVVTMGPGKRRYYHYVPVAIRPPGVATFLSDIQPLQKQRDFDEMSGGLAASRDSSSDRAGRFEERILNENCCSCKAFTQPLKLRALQMDERETCGVAVRGEASLPVCRIPMQLGLHVRPRATSPDISNI